jgi:hypothetical protein
MLFSRKKTLLWLIAIALPMGFILFAVIGMILGALGMDIHWTHR